MIRTSEGSQENSPGHKSLLEHYTQVSLETTSALKFPRFLCIPSVQACFILPAYVSIPILFFKYFCSLKEGVQSVAI